MAEVDLMVMGEAIRQWRAAKHGERQAVLLGWLPLLGVSAATFYREEKRWGRRGHGSRERRPRADKGVPEGDPRRRWVEEIVKMKHRGAPGMKPAATWLAQRAAYQQGLIPEEALKMSVGTINRLARELGLRNEPRREQRFQAAFANQLHQLDASGSNHFIPVRREGDDWLVKLRLKGRKNREKAERLRVWCWGLVDDFSGMRLSQYVVAPGESAANAMRFLQWAWAAHPEHAPFAGLPQILYMDNGPLAKIAHFREWAAAVGVEVMTHEPYRPQATGKVESAWRHQWEAFERSYFLDPGWEGRELLLSQVNRELAAFCREANQRQHRSLGMTREEAWLASVREQGGIPHIDPGAWAGIHREADRRLDAAGCFDYRGRTYQVKEIHSRPVIVYEGVLDGGILVEDKRDGKRYRAELFTAPSLGEWRGVPKSPVERLTELDRATAEIPAVRPAVFGAEQSNVRHLVPRGEVRGQELAPEPQPPSGEREPESGFYANPLERYAVLKVRELAGQRLTPEEAEFLRQVEAEYEMQTELLLPGLQQKARLALAE